MAEKKFPQYKIMAVSKLIPYARNSRVHSEEQILQVAASIREFGFLAPVVVDKDSTIVAGHCRVLAAQRLGLDSVPTIQASHLTDAQRRAYVIADNKLTLNSSWDEEMLKVEFEDLAAEGIDLALTGFAQYEIDQINFEEEDGETDPNEEWDGMPEYDQDDQMSWKRLIVHFANEDDLESFARLVNQRIGQKTKFIWYPEAEKPDTGDMTYE